MPVETMTDLAVTLEVLATVLYTGIVVWNWIVPILPADHYLFALLGDLCLHVARLACFTADQMEHN